MVDIGGFGGMGGGFGIVGTLLPIFFVVILIIVVVKLISGVAEWSNNNRQPVLTVEAGVVAKRTAVSHHNHNTNGQAHMHTSTTYYVTFQVESGDRMEFRLSGREYGQLAEGDHGRLTFQGTRYHGYERW